MLALLGRIKSKWQNTKAPCRWDWAVFAIVFLLSYLLFYHYYDLITITGWSVSFIDLLIRGQMLEFHDIVLNANYHELIMFVYGLMLVPLRVIVWIFGVSEIPFLTWVMYGKFIISLWIAVAAYLLYKLALEIGISKDNGKWVVFLFLTSPALLFGTVLFGQIDIFAIVFSLWSLMFFARKQYWKFTLIMIPAICFKVFPLFIFVPLILLVEKRLYKIVLHILCVLSGLFISPLLYGSSAGFRATQQFIAEEYGFIGRFYHNSFFGHDISVFIMCFIMVCFICYVVKFDDRKTGVYIAGIPTVVYGLFFLFYPTHPQWFAIITPYLALLVLLFKNKKPVILVDGLFLTGVIFHNVFYSPMHTDNYMVNHGILPAITGRTYMERTIHFHLNALYHDINKLVMTLLITGLLILIALAGYKLLKKETQFPLEESFTLERGLIWLRPAILLICYMIPTLVLYISS